MVKNSAGGNKSKKMGRKFTSAPIERAVRMACEEGEMFAVVTKLYGHGMCQVRDTENIERLCIIRNKFKGRGKRDNIISLGSWLLIGIREWESGEKVKCDLLEVYNEIEKQKLKKTGNPVFKRLHSEFDKFDGDDGESNEVTFGDEETNEYRELLEQTILDDTNNESMDANIAINKYENKGSSKNTKNEKQPSSIIYNDEEGEVDIDDI